MNYIHYMARPRPKKRIVNRLPRERREADILEAAQHVFRLRGYENASISEIAERAGVVEGSIYRYFQNKRDLVIKVIEQWYLGMISEEEAWLPGIEGARNKLRHAIWQHLHAIRLEPGLSRLVFSEFRPDPQYRQTTIFALNRRYTSRVTDIVREGMQNGEFRADVSPALVRNLIYGCIEHHTWAFLRGEGDFNVERTADAITNLLCQGLEPVALPAAPSAAARKKRL